MDLRKHFSEALTIVTAAVICAVVANALAAHDRRIQLVASYPNALTVPDRSASTVNPSPAQAATAPQVPSRTPPSAPATPPAASPTPTPAVAVPTQDATATATPTQSKVPLVAPRTSTAGPAAPVTTTATHAAAQQRSEPAPAAAPNVTKFKAHPNEPWVELHGDDVAALHQEGALFLDARRSSVYAEGHIAGARSFPVWESDIDEKVNRLYEELGNDPVKANQPIVVYCTGGDCEDSHMLGQKLWGLQFNNVYVYKDGFPDWQKRGGSIHTGAQP